MKALNFVEQDLASIARNLDRIADSLEILSAPVAYGLDLVRKVIR